LSASETGEAVYGRAAYLLRFEDGSGRRRLSRVRPEQIDRDDAERIGNHRILGLGSLATSAMNRSASARVAHHSTTSPTIRYRARGSDAVEHQTDGLMFPSPREATRPFDPRSVARRADKACWKDAGLLAKQLILHEGRHSAASAYIASGLDPIRVSKWLGHSQVSTTTDVYAKAFAARERHDAAPSSTPSTHSRPRRANVWASLRASEGQHQPVLGGFERHPPALAVPTSAAEGKKGGLGAALLFRSRCDHGSSGSRELTCHSAEPAFPPEARSHPACSSCIRRLG
jgi:integrase-like protein